MQTLEKWVEKKQNKTKKNGLKPGWEGLGYTMKDFKFSCVCEGVVEGKKVGWHAHCCLKEDVSPARWRISSHIKSFYSALSPE